MFVILDRNLTVLYCQLIRMPPKTKRITNLSGNRNVGDTSNRQAQSRRVAPSNPLTSVDAPFCLGYLFHFNVRETLGPFVLRFEFGPRTYFIMWFIYFYGVFDLFLC